MIENSCSVCHFLVQLNISIVSVVEWTEPIKGGMLPIPTDINTSGHVIPN